MTKLELTPATPKRIRLVRESVGKIVHMLAGKQIPVTQKGSQAYVATDPDTLEIISVNIPVIQDNASNQMLDAIQGFIDHECAHVLFTDQSICAEAHKSGKAITKFWNIIEDTYIEREVSKMFIGSAHNLANTRNLVLDMFIDPKYKKLVEAGEAAEEIHFFSVLAVPVFRAWAGQSEMQDYMSDKWDRIPNVVDCLRDIKDEVETIPDSKACLELAKEVIERLFKEGEGGDDEDGNDESDESGESGKKSKAKSSSSDSEDSDGESASAADAEDSEDEGEEESAPGSSDDESEDEGESDSEDEGEEESEDEGQSEGDGESEDESDADEGDSEEEGESEDEGEAESESPSSPPEKAEMSDHVSSPFDLDEFDENEFEDFDGQIEKLVENTAIESHEASEYVPYTLDYDKFEVVETSHNSFQNEVRMLEETTSEMIGPLARHLKRVFVAQNKSTWERGRRRGKVNASSLHRLVANDDRVMKKQRISRTRDVAVELLIDCSGSMSGSCIKTAMQAAFALGEVLDQLKISNEIIGFTTREVPYDLSHEYRSNPRRDTYDRVTPIYMPIFKEFHESFGNPQKRRLAKYAYAGYGSLLHTNVDGESVRYAADRLLRRKEPGKTMLVLSDGLPSAAAAEDNRKLCAHLKQVCEDIEADGVNLVGIGIETDIPKRFYRKHVVLKNVRDLPGTVIEEIKRAILQK